MNHHDDKILAFSHVPKTGGITIRYLLRRYFGLRHLDAKYRTSEGAVYSVDNLRTDLRLLPRLRSIAGHTLKPFVDYQEHADRLLWYTILRKPETRFISHYQHEIEKGGKRLSIHEWAKKFKRSNWHVRMFAGEEDVAAAKQILRERFVAVGFQEHFDDSLRVIFSACGLSHFPVEYQRPKNKSGSSLKRKLHEQMDEMRDLIEENNSLDIELYRYALEELWPEQLAQVPEPWETREIGRARQAVNLTSNFVFRNAFYKPSSKLGSYLAKRKVRES